MKRRTIVRTAVIFSTVLATVFVTLLILNLSLGDKQIDWRLPHRYAVASEHFPRTMGTLLGPALVTGNRVEELLNGEQIFPSMLAAINAATRSISFESYIYWSGDVGRQFADALSAQARNGVPVRVLLDWVGSEALDDSQLERMREAGVQVSRYNRPRWYNLGRLNNRTHRKLLIIDGRIGFTGGAGIADQWEGDGRTPGQWRDTQYRAEGPVVAQMQAAFIDNWLQATGQVPYGNDLLPPPADAGDQRAQMFTSSPGAGAESVQLMYLLSIASAAHSIKLSMAYFVPDDVAVNAFVAAMKRGVKVQLILPGDRIDVEIVRHASRAEWGELLAAGAEIYEYQPSMYHCKVMIVDDLWVSVGSTNFDSRSFSVNDEANLNVYDAAFARRQSEIFEQDRQRSRLITHDEWLNRPWREKITDFFASLLSSQL